MMFMQLGIWREISDGVPRDDLLSNFIRFDDQALNQELARKGSIDGSLATLDLSEASDRVSYQLVLAMLGNHPHLRAGIDATRSRRADVPGHGVQRLAKFASMGSALCFPFEAFVFLTIVFLAIEHDAGVPLTRKAMKAYAGRVAVYGDDIIVPVDNAATVVRYLSLFGLKVNSGKSFWSGNFRESCGKEYYRGHDVSIVRIREELPTQRQHAKQIVSAVSMRNQFYQMGLVKTVESLDRIIERFIPFPVVAETSALLGKHNGAPTVRRWDMDLQIPLVKGVAVHAPLPKSDLEGEFAILKCLLKMGSKPLDMQHLERAGRPRAVYLKPRWATPY